ncbi:response regulator transcription factor [Actinoplanes sp. NPDC049596]|uniref:response regulator transcription factor n=1 Tax=unclassified Actinoplanes TaxID=2626549 RepID=UPI0034427500
MTRVPRVFVVDKYPLFRAGIRSTLESITSLDFVGEAGTGEDAFRELGRLEPAADVVLVGLQPPDRSGIDVARRLSAVTEPGYPGSRVLVISSNEDDEAVVAALRAGAYGYLVRWMDRDELLRAIDTVAAGGAVFSPMVADRLRTYFSAVHDLPSRMAFPALTDREREILDLLARGHDNRRIARALVLSEKTVRNHVSKVFMKLQVSKRAEAAVRARDAGLGI